MSDIESTDWSEIAANNVQPAPGGWPPNSSPNIVYSNGREQMGAIKRWWDRTNPTVTSGGSANAQTLTYAQGPTAYVQGQTYTFFPGFANSGPTTLNVNGLGAKNLLYNGVFLPSGALVVGSVVQAAYDGAQFQIIGASNGVAAASNYLPLAGGTLTGPLTINTGPTQLALNVPAAAGRNIVGQTAGVLRWNLQLGNATGEGGSNAGSDLAINRYADGGGVIDSPLTITRSTAAAVFSNTVRCLQGFLCQAGQGGTAGGNKFNINFGTGSQLWIDATNTGTITVTSDYRTKRDIAELSSMWERTRKLKPISFKYKDWTPSWEEQKEQPFFRGDDVERWGFVAHELQETLVADAANGSKDEEHVIQSPNPWTVLAAVTKTLQEAMARIEALETKVARLEAGLAAAATA